MKRFACIIAILAAGATSACGDASNPADTVDDVLIGVDVDTNDALTDTSLPDSVARDTPEQDTFPADTFVPDNATNDISTDDLAAEDTGVADVAADVPVIPTTPWTKMAVTIDDPVVNGTSVMNPVDGMSFGYNPDGLEFVTQFDRGWDDPSITYLWHLDELTGVHSKKFTTGDVFADGTNFCMDEDWCQFIGYDETDSTWVVMGPRSPAVMKVDSTWVASQFDLITGETDQPPNGGISYTHLFTGDGFWVYGYITASGFCDTLSFFDLATSDWQIIKTGLAPLFANCIAIFKDAGQIFSIGGVTTEDGGETSHPYGKLQVISVDSPDNSESDLPAGLADREGISCAADEANGRLFVFGGAVVNDNYDERNNVYHNDLWIYEDGTWTQILVDGAIGEFRQYGDSWMLKADTTLPNFGKNFGKMMFDDSVEPRLILMGDVPGAATQIYTLNISDLEL